MSTSLLTRIRICIFFFSLLTSILGAQKLLLLDTARQERHFYEPFISIAQSAGFNVTYHAIDKVLDSTQDNLALKDYDAIFFLLNQQFLKTIKTSPVAQKVVDSFQAYAKMEGKLVGLIFPPLTSGISALNLMLDSIDLEISKTDDSERAIYAKEFYTLADRFLSVPLERRPRHYETTLAAPNTGKQLETKQPPTTSLALLPIKQEGFTKNVSSKFPYGIYWFNKVHKNHLFISSTSALNFSGIMENFWLCPMDSTIKQEMHNALHQMMWELASIRSTKKGIDVTKLSSTSKPSLPQHVMAQKTQITKPKVNTAWMNITIYDDPTKEVQQDKLIDYILDGGLTHLWLEIVPNSYYSPIAAKKEHKEKLRTQIAVFTKKLSEAAQQKGVPIPKLLAGYILDRNLHGENQPQVTTKDLYGTSYVDLPPPLDENFWDSEIIIPLTELKKDWDAIAHGVPLSGLVLDFEMYDRKTSNVFLSTMGFEKETFDTYRGHFPQPLIEKGTSPENHIEMLIRNGATQSYYTFLEDQAKTLGEKMHATCNEIIPDCMIAVYVPMIISNWFFKGMYSGLSTPTQPIQLYTFNTEFNAHRPWCARNDISAEHSCVMLLGKFKNSNDFGKIDAMLAQHDGIWLNRFSKMVEPHYDWDVENTAMSLEDKEACMHHLRQAGKN